MFSKKIEGKKVELIVVDPGKHTTKAIRTDMNAVDFRTKMFDNTEEIDVHGNSYSVIYDGKKYIIGEQGDEQSYDVSKTNLLHKLVTYVAITELADNESIIQLVLNCPVTIYKNKELRDEYKNYIFNNGKFNITVNEIEYYYEFENILVLPEDYGVVHRYPHLFDDKRVILVGLGGLNMNFLPIDNFVPDIEKMFTVNHGCNELETNLVNALISKLGKHVDHKDAPYILSQKGVKEKGNIRKDSTLVVEKVIYDFIGDIIQEIKRNGHDLDAVDVVFVGGTSGVIQDYIKSVIKHATIVKEPRWAAIEGSLKVGEIKYGESKA